MSDNRPGLLVGILGTATDVGKTWASARLADGLRHDGLEVRARKSAQSYDPDDPGPTDAEVLAAATADDPERVTPRHRWYEVPMAPPMAAEVLELPIPYASDLVGELDWGGPADIGLYETVGGVASPVAVDASSHEIIAVIGVDAAIIVADAGLGTIDAVRLATATLGSTDHLVLLNRFDPASDLHRRNAQWLVETDGMPVVTSVDEVAAWVRSRSHLE